MKAPPAPLDLVVLLPVDELARRSSLDGLPAVTPPRPPEPVPPPPPRSRRPS